MDRLINIMKANLRKKCGLFSEDNKEEEVPVVRKQIKTLFISAGHSYTDPGAAGRDSEGKLITEADIVLEFRDMVASHLRELGVGFVKDGEKGENLPLAKAITLAKGKDIAVEFHCNAFHLPSATGVETLSRSHHYKVAERINQIIASTLSINNRGAKGESSGAHSRLGFISRADGIIVELFFISNPSDVAKYKKHKHTLAKKMAELLADMVLEGE